MLELRFSAGRAGVPAGGAKLDGGVGSVGHGAADMVDSHAMPAEFIGKTSGMGV